VTDEAAARAIEAQVEATLDRLGVPYEIHRIDPAYADTAAYCQHYGVPLDRSANTIIVASKKEPRQYAACVVPATTRLDVNHAVRRLMTVSRVSFASAQETIDLTGMMIGGVTVLALPPALPVYVDDRLMGFEWVILGGGSRSAKIKVTPELFRRLAGARIVEGLGVEAPAAPAAPAC
jgi:prolyl-tRNA editing enzyme YbaK/EbsC (Cys-tRNA(Pro) deacylase)